MINDRDKPEGSLLLPICEDPYFTVAGGKQRYTEQRRCKLTRTTARHVMRSIARDVGIYPELRTDFGVEFLKITPDQLYEKEDAADYTVEAIGPNKIMLELALNHLEQFLVTVARTK